MYRMHMYDRMHRLPPVSDLRPQNRRVPNPKRISRNRISP